ncbi:MAG: sigma-54-dependent transcriptional regulator [Chloroflexota bacterium]
MNVAIIDDNADFCSTVADIVESFGHSSIPLAEPERAIAFIKSKNKHIDVVFLDIEFGPGATLDGLDVLEFLRQNYPSIPVIMISGKGTIETAVRATKLGALNFVEKSLVSKAKIKEILDSAARSLGPQSSSGEIARFLHSQGIIGHGARMIDVGDSIVRYGRTDLNVLITGETGTGKKLVARALHAISRRAKAPFVTVDIPNIPKELFQSELFGHNKGSFSGAHDTKKGLFHEANKGSIFLDEIGDLLPELQSSLFIPIEEKIVRRVGSVQSEDVDIRFISATDKDLLEGMRSGKFREQLYHRLRECEIYLPPLRERKEDIPDIVEFYLGRHNMEFADSKFFSARAVEFIQEQNWKGNVRELASVLKVTLQTTQRENIEPPDIQRVLMSSPVIEEIEAPELRLSTNRTLKEDLAMTDKQKIEQTLKVCNGNVSKSAALLGVSRETLHNKIRRYEINVQQFRTKG